MSERARRRKLERDVKNGKKINTPVQEILYNLKYTFDDEVRQLQVLNTLDERKFTSINGNPLPKSILELGEKGHTYTTNELLKEIRWYTFNIKKNSNVINEYLKLEDNVYANILSGNYSESKRILKYIEENICVSHWSIEQDLIIAEYESGFKKNKETLANVINIKNQNLTNIFARYQSVRVEKNLSFFTYQEILDPFVRQHPSYIQDLLNFKLNYFKSDTFDNSGVIFGFLNGFSIIDNYNLFITIIISIVSRKEKNEINLQEVKKSLIQLKSYISDVRINNILISLGEIDEVQLTTENLSLINVLDFYTEGRYYDVINFAKELLLANSNLFELYELYIKSLINLGLKFENFFIQDSIAHNTLHDLNNIIRKNNSYSDSVANAYKTYNSLGLTSWTYKYFVYFNIEHSNYSSEINVQQFSMLYSKYYNPAECIFLEENSLHYLGKLAEKCPKSETIAFWKRISSSLFDLNIEETEPSKTASYRETFYKIKILDVKKEYSKALSEYEALENNEDFAYEISLPHNLEDLLYSKLKCLLNLDQLDAAVNLTVESLFKNKFLKNRLGSKYLIDKITFFDDQNLLKNISSSIILHQYQHLLEPHDLWIVYDEFMTSQNLGYPKELEKNQDAFLRDQLVYFLKNLCKQDIYDSSPLFESQDELDNERVEVCRLLSELDNENFENYINEIAEINRNQLIRKGIKQIDESKIYVDVNGIRSALDKDIRESFERSLNLLNLPLDQIKKIDDNTERILVPYFTKNNDLKTDSIQSVKITSYSRFSQFTDMFSKIRDKFIASNEFGIDTYLSMRIRHGTLLGEIRSVFELYNLVTKKEDTSNKYQENIFWKDKLHFKSDFAEESFDSIMSKFSFEIDSICNDLKNNKVQIKTEKKNSDGLFDYSFSEKDLLQIFKYEIGDINLYEDFFDTVIIILWERTEKILFNIREHISSSIKPKMITMLNDLSRTLENQIDKNENPELNEIIRNITSCQTEISNELDKISSWFKRSNSKSINEFEIDLPINASLTILKRIFKDYNNLSPYININCPIRFEGENFPHFTYIMQNLFHNILTHSKLSSKDLNIEISAELKNEMLTIKIENNFSPILSLEEINSKISYTRDLLLQTHDNEKTRAEDGTGYIKIRKTLVTDLIRKKYSIEICDVDDTRIFKTIISFEIDNLEKKMHDEDISN